MYPLIKSLHATRIASPHLYSNLIDLSLSFGSFSFASSIHAQLIKIGLNVDTFLGNRCLEMYVHFGPVGGAWKVFEDIREKNTISWNVLLKGLLIFGHIERAGMLFDEMPQRDVVSWNSMISGLKSRGFNEYAVSLFMEMQIAGFRPSGYTYSIMISVARCTHQGKEIHGSIIRTEFGNGLYDAVRLFDEVNKRDLAICNSMISSYARHGFGYNGLQIFLSALRENLRPSEFTLSSVLGCVSVFMPAELSMQLHSFVVKSGFECDPIVASSLLDIYAKVGLIESTIDIFKNMEVKDLTSWNTFLMGLATNGREHEVIQIFKEAAGKGLRVDSITLAAVLLACNYGGFFDEGLAILSAMEKDYGIVPTDEHYAHIVNLLGRAGKLEEAMDIVSKMPYLTSSTVWRSLLCACTVDGDLKIIKKVAERVMEMDPRSDLPHVVLARAYQARGMWEGMIRAIYAVRHKSSEKSSGCSWVGMKNIVCVFRDCQLQYPGEMDVDLDLALVLRLLDWEAEEEDDQVKA